MGVQHEVYPEIFGAPDDVELCELCGDSLTFGVAPGGAALCEDCAGALA